MVRTAHTADLDAATLAAARALLDDVFEGELTDDDWEHCHGGIHALAYDDDDARRPRRRRPAPAALRRARAAGRATSRASASAAPPPEGHADALMAALERIIRAAYDLGALGATDEALPFYAQRGWRAWEGPLSILTPDRHRGDARRAGRDLRPHRQRST